MVQRCDEVALALKKVELNYKKKKIPFESKVQVQTPRLKIGTVKAATKILFCYEPGGSLWKQFASSTEDSVRAELSNIFPDADWTLARWKDF